MSDVGKVGGWWDFTQKEADWFGRIDVEEGVLEMLTEGFPEEQLSQGVSSFDFLKRYGHPSIDEWLKRQYREGIRVPDKQRKGRSLIKHFQVKSYAPPHALYSIRVETWPRNLTRLSLAPMPHGVDSQSMN